MNRAVCRSPRRTRHVAGALSLLAAGALISAGCSAPASAPPATTAEAAPAAAPVPPAPLVGEWGIQIKFFEHPVDGVLRFSPDHGAVFGSFSDDEGNQSELEKLHVDGNKISFQIERKNGTLTAKGTIEGTIMNGKMRLRRNDEESGIGVSGGGSRGGGGYGGRRVGEPDSYAWTAVKRAEAGTPPAPAPPPPPGVWPNRRS